MSRRLLIAITAVFAGIWFCLSAAVADSVPSWDVTTSCRGAAESGYVQDTTDNLKRCLGEEQRTREQLNKDWSTFPAADRVKCVKTQTFSPTYTELATCLEMQRDIKNGAKPGDAVPRK